MHGVGLACLHNLRSTCQRANASATRDALTKLNSQRSTPMTDFELQDELQALQLGTTTIEHDHDFSSEDPEHLLEGQ